MRKIFLCLVLCFSLIPTDYLGRVEAQTTKNKTELSKSKSKKKLKEKKRKSKKSKKARKGKYSSKRFKYKRGGPDLKVLTKESSFSDVPDNGVTPLDQAPAN